MRLARPEHYKISGTLFVAMRYHDEANRVWNVKSSGRTLGQVTALHMLAPAKWVEHRKKKESGGEMGAGARRV